MLALFNEEKKGTSCGGNQWVGIWDEMTETNNFTNVHTGEPAQYFRDNRKTQDLSYKALTKCILTLGGHTTTPTARIGRTVLRCMLPN